MATLEEAPEIIDGYTNFEWNSGKPITYGYGNEDTLVETNDDEYEYEHSNRVQEELVLEEKLRSMSHWKTDRQYNKWVKISNTRRNPSSYQNILIIKLRKRMTQQYVMRQTNKS